MLLGPLTDSILVPRWVILTHLLVILILIGSLTWAHHRLRYFARQFTDLASRVRKLAETQDWKGRAQ